ncbi:MAG: helicase-exonuclease AddAB subunit AddA [Veillonellales bacterium]
MSWSEQQLAAIEARQQNLLVAAAAGSGKTSVLVERMIRRITDPLEPVDVDKMLVVTFTNAAAAEMRSRIGAALNDALRQQPRSRHLERQLVLLNSASISTIHSFCQTIVRQNFHLLNLDPQFRVAGDAEIKLLKGDVLEDLFEQRYGDGDAAFLRFADHYGNEKSDEPLYALVLGLYNFSRSHPWPDHWLGHLKQAFALPADTDIDATPWSGLIREKIVLELDRCRQQLDALSRKAAEPGMPAEYITTFTADKGVLDELIDAAGQSWVALAGALTRAEFAKIVSVKGLDETVKKYFQNSRKKVKDKVKECQTLYFDRPPEELLADMVTVAPLVDTLSRLTVDFGVEFAKAKRAKGLLDFNDLEHFCLQALLQPEAGPGELKPSAVATALRQKYAEIMVDEYQDTNGVQETILRLVARPDVPNLFLVGDVKQSIYRFRLAEPELFMEKYRCYPTNGDAPSRRIDLTQNFRSRAGVLHAVNFLFDQLMSARVAELDYGEAEQLNPGPDYPSSEGLTLTGPVELCLIDREDSQPAEIREDEEKETGDESEAVEEEELSGFEWEARFLVKRIGELMIAGYQVYDKSSKKYRKLTWRDMVVLLRSVKGKAGVLLNVLRQAGIPAYAEADAGYFKEIEVQVMLSLLSVIDNPRQDIQLAGVLRSPVVGLKAGQMAELRLAKPDADLWGALAAFVRQAEEFDGGQETDKSLRCQVREFVEQLNRWRSLSRRKGVPELIWQIYRDTGYYDYAGGMPGGTLRQANLRALYDRARQYETTNFRGLFRFLRFIDQLQDKGSDLAVARALGESEDVVRIMSIHKSKGLEFPVVFLADLGKQFNLQDSRALVLCHKTLGVGPYVTDPELRYRYPTLARQGIAHKLTMETKAEELRILYVALTRAREKLILIGSVDRLAKRAAEWCQFADRQTTSLPDSLIAGAKSYLDWLCPAIARHPSGQKLRDYGECNLEPAGEMADHPAAWEVNILSSGDLSEKTEEPAADLPLLNAVEHLQPVEEGEGTDWVEERLGWQYPFQAAVGKPAKVSVTEMKRRFDDLKEADGQPLIRTKLIVTRPRFLQTTGKLTGAEYGTVMHSVMQQLSLQGDLTAAGVKNQVADMVKRELLLPEQAAAIDANGVAGFFAGSLGQRLCASPRVRRELPFSLMLPAERYYEDLPAGKEGIFIQGVIDVLFDEGDDVILLDYKTDRAADSAELADRYALQLNLYAEAVQRIFHKTVKEKFLYAFSTRETIRVE